MLSDAEVLAWLQKEARGRYGGNPELQLSELRFLPDRTLVCGLATVPGEAPVVFTSSDATPQTLERTMSLPDPTPETDNDKRFKLEVLTQNQDLCRRWGLMPPLAVTVEVEGVR